MIINITFDGLANAVESFYNIELINNCEIDITSLGITVPTPSGPAVVSHIIKKERLPGVIITTKAGRVAKTAKKHILVSNDTDIFADELSVGDSIVTQNGQDEIVSIVDAGCFDCYDIAVPSPHYYYDAAGILHHNTIITATLGKRVEQYGRSIVIVPNKSLVSQTEDDFKLLGLDVGVYFGDRKEVGRTHTIVTWQSLSTIMRAKKKGEESKASIEDFTDNLVCVMVDECHVSKADVLHSLLSGEFANVPIRWGLTGTIPKEKFAQVSLGVNIGEVISEVSAAELQEKGFLSNCHISVLQLKDFGEYKNYQQELQYLTTNPERIRAIAKMLDEIAKNGNTLILVDRIATGTMLLEEMESEAIFINGGVGVNKRKEHYADVASADGKVIIATYGVAAVGLNIPRVFNVVLLEPGKSFVRVIQSIGRGLRKAHDKDYVAIWDIASSCKYSKRHLNQRKQFYAEAEYQYTIKKLDWKK